MATKHVDATAPTVDAEEPPAKWYSTTVLEPSQEILRSQREVEKLRSLKSKRDAICAASGRATAQEEEMG